VPPAEAHAASPHQLPEDRGRGLGVAQGRVRRAHLQLQQLHHPGQPGRLAAGQVEHQLGQRRGVDDGVLQRLLEAAPDEVGVEGVVAVLDQHRPAREAEEGRAGFAEAGRARQHGAVDLVALLRVAVDRGAGLHQRVEEGQRAREPEALGADLDDQEGPVAGGLHVERDVLGFLERGPGGDRRAFGQELGIQGALAEPRLEPHLQYAFLWLQTRKNVIRRILRSNARLQFSM